MASPSAHSKGLKLSFRGLSYDYFYASNIVVSTPVYCSIRVKIQLLSSNVNIAIVCSVPDPNQTLETKPDPDEDPT